FLSFFFLHDTLTTKIYPLSLHDALPISRRAQREEVADHYGIAAGFLAQRRQRDRFPGVSTERAHRMGKFRDLWGKDPARATGRQRSQKPTGRGGRGRVREDLSRGGVPCLCAGPARQTTGGVGPRPPLRARVASGKPSPNYARLPGSFGLGGTKPGLYRERQSSLSRGGGRGRATGNPPGRSGPAGHA